MIFTGASSSYLSWYDILLLEFHGNSPYKMAITGIFSPIFSGISLVRPFQKADPGYVLLKAQGPTRLQELKPGNFSNRIPRSWG
jgi:hypothetical protein